MKIIKPQGLSLLTRSYEFQRRFYLGVSVITYIPLQQELSMLPEVALWKFAAEALGKDAALDTCIPKSMAEFLVTGSAHTPNANPQQACRVAASLGTLRKELFVIGDRYWNGNIASDPVPFTEMPLDWEHAFGGTDYTRNPLGRGYEPIQVDGRKIQPLPNVEHPNQLVTHPNHRPEPACYGPIDQMWPQRAKKVGTYDDDWLKNDFPGYARDIDWSFFNLTAADQQQTSPFNGDEVYRFDNMHPTEPVVEGRLPGVLARSFINRKVGETEAFEEVPLRLTTCWFFPHAKRAILIYQGNTQVIQDDAADVAQIVIAAERQGHTRPRDHYERVLGQRLDKERGHLYALRDQDLMPEGLGKADSNVNISQGPTPGLMHQNMRRKAEKEFQESRDVVASYGLNPDEHGPPSLPPERPLPKLEELPEFLEKIEKQAEETRREEEEDIKHREAELEKTFQSMGMDYNVIRDEQKATPKGPPTFSADSRVRELREIADSIRDQEPASAAHVDEIYQDDDNLRLWKNAERQLLQSYVTLAHHQTPADVMEAGKLEATRQAVLATHAQGAPMTGWDLTGADLSGLDLSGADLEGALMESARLEGTNLEGANMNGAVLAHAVLRGTRLTGARLQGANLGGSDLEEALLDDTDMTGGILAKARLTKTNLQRAILLDTDFMDSQFTDTDLSGARLDGLSFIENDLRGVRLTGASLRKCNFIKADMRAVDLCEADLGEAVLITVRAAGARFTKASMIKTRIIENSDLDHASLTECNMTDANLRGCRLIGCDLSDAVADRADFSGCDLRGANLYRVVAREAMWVKARLDQATLVSANLMKGILRNADLYGTDLRGANLFGVDLSRAGTDSATNFTDALMKRAQMLPAREA